MEKTTITIVNPIPKEYSAKCTNRLTLSISTKLFFISKFAFELAETELTNKIKSIINKKLVTTLPELGTLCQISANIVKTIPIIVVESKIQSFTLILFWFSLIFFSSFLCLILKLKFSDSK